MLISSLNGVDGSRASASLSYTVLLLMGNEFNFGVTAELFLNHMLSKQQNVQHQSFNTFIVRKLSSK